ncbi:hypothetical protein OAU50_07095 [Planctomycetota bacterium]|nr:hypothetical protein [Planctomycetota bacterium]
MNLTDAQLQLLHAKLDDELVSDEEETEVQRLLEDVGVQEYFDTCLKIRNLVAQHAPIPAPVDLKARVLASTPKNNVQNLNDYRWRTGWISAAAAVVVSVGVMFGLNHNSSPDAPTIATERAFAPSNSRILRDQTISPPAPTAPDKDTWNPKKEAEETSDSAIKKGPTDETDGTGDLSVFDNKKDLDKHKAKRAVLNLDRGREIPMSLNLHLNRAQSVSVDQAYNDLLMVTAMYGDAEMQETETSTETFEDEEFDGNDFSSIEGILISIPEHELEELLASVNRMAGEQEFGRVAVPEDLSPGVKSVENSLVSEFDNASQLKTRNALGYAPRKTRESMDSISETNGIGGGAGAGTRSSATKQQPESRNIKLFLRLR